MGDVIVFPRHKMQNCRCGEWACPICSGGLAICTTCGGQDGAMPTDCPQRPMTEEEFVSVMEELLDYNRGHGGWTDWTRAKMLAVKKLVT